MDFNLYSHLSQALNWLAPNKCYGCLKILSRPPPFCDACYIELPFQSNTCQQCGQAYAANRDYCGRCIITPPAYDRCFCPFEYQTPIKDLICGFKYREKVEHANMIGQLLAREIKNKEEPMPDIIVPVPIHIAKLRSRGFNQAKLIATIVGRKLNVPVTHKIIIKTRSTPPQAKQSLANRKKALSGCFAVQQPFSAKNVAIVDDVVTTGSTVNEISKVLKKNGANYVQVWGVAHTL